MVWRPHRLVKSVFQGHWQLQAMWPETSEWLWSHFWRMQKQEQRLKSLQMMPGLRGVPPLHLLCAFIFLYHQQIRVCNEIFLFLQWPSKNSTWLPNKIKKTHQFIINKTFSVKLLNTYMGLNISHVHLATRVDNVLFNALFTLQFTVSDIICVFEKDTLNFLFIFFLWEALSNLLSKTTPALCMISVFTIPISPYCPKPHSAKVSMFLTRGGLITCALAN